MDKKKSILLIDDDNDVREFLNIFLEDKGFDVIEAENGRKAKAIIDGKKPDLIISDLLLPGEHGLEVIKYIKDKYFLPVIAISGIYDEAEIKKDIEEMYIDGFLKKPIDAIALTALINKILNT